MSKESILEQALLQVQNLEEAVKQNAKGILASTMKQELNELLKESLEEEEEVYEQPSEDEETEDLPVETGDDEETSINDEPDVDADGEGEFESMGDEPSLDDEPSDEISGDDEFSDEFSDDEFSDDDETLDMTDASDDEVLKVYKSMKPEDGIIVKKDGDNIAFEDGENEYLIKTDSDLETETPDEEFSDDDFSSEETSDDEFESEMSEEDETVYEIDLGDENPEEEEMGEAARTKWNPHGDKGGAKRSGLPSKKVFKAGSGQVNEEVEKLRKQNGEYKKALVLFKEKLNEVAVFNANLAYAVRLITEHSTTKQEKVNILKRFDTVNTMKESKALFESVKNELGNKNTISETVAKKITVNPTSSSQKDVLAESKAYENPQFKRMKDLMNKIK